MILDHIGISVSNFQQSKDFFAQAPAPLGITLLMEVDGWAGYGKGGKPELWLTGKGEPVKAMHGISGPVIPF